MDDRILSFGDVRGIVGYRKWSLIVPICLISLMSIIIAFALPAYYKSTSTILIEEQEIPSDFVMATVTSYIEKRLQTINQRIMSTSVLMDIIKRFKLYPDLQEKHTIEEIVDAMRNDISMQPIDADVIDRRTGRATKATIAFTLSYQGKNPNTVHKITNVLTSLYLEENLKIRERQAKETSAFLQDEVDRVKQKLEIIDGQITELKEAHINELPELMQINIQGLSSTERQIDMAREQMRSLREREEYLMVQLAAIPSEEADLNKKRMDELRLTLVRLRTEFSDYYPDIVKIKKEIQALETQLVEEDKNGTQEKAASDTSAYITLSSQLAGVQSEIELVQSNMVALQADRETYQERLEITPQVEAEYSSLLMEKRNTQIKYDDLISKSMEAKIAQGLEQNQKGERFTLIDPPMFPEKPFKPKRLLIVLIGVILSVGAAIGIVSLQELTDTSFRKTERLSGLEGFPVLGTIPDILTQAEIAAKKRKTRLWSATVLVIMIAGIVVFHFFIMDLNVFWAKVMRKMA